MFRNENLGLCFSFSRMRSGCREMSANGIPHSCVFPPPYHESASEENRREGRIWSTYVQRPGRYARRNQRSFQRWLYKIKSHGLACQCATLYWNASVERNVPRRSLGGNTTPSGGLLICSIGAKASAMGGGMTAGDMACEFVVSRVFPGLKNLGRA